jgi:hypothetical protein
VLSLSAAVAREQRRLLRTSRLVAARHHVAIDLTRRLGRRLNAIAAIVVVIVVRAHRRPVAVRDVAIGAATPALRAGRIAIAARGRLVLLRTRWAITGRPGLLPLTRRLSVA